MRVLISAGEASGEMYGAQLIEALRGVASAELRSAARTATSGLTQIDIDFYGVGGEKMRAAGCETIVDAKDLSVVGITEILGHLLTIYGLFQKLIAEADKRRPDLAIVIDSPAFNWRVARQMYKRGIPVVYYVCPQFWAWRQGRVRLLRKYVTKALVIFPFEEKFYRDRGVDATFVGHPLADLQKPRISRADYATQHQIDPMKQWITLMPGSRAKEVRMNLPTILEAAKKLGPSYEFLLPVAPTLSATWVKTLIPAELVVHLVSEALPPLAHARAGIIASGTATVEAAIMGLPFVMVYRVSPLTYALGRPRIKVPHFAMVNLIAGHQVVPELVQKHFTAERVVEQMRKILPDGAARTSMLDGFRTVVHSLSGSDNGRNPAPNRAAEVIVNLLHKHAQ